MSSSTTPQLTGLDETAGANSRLAGLSLRKPNGNENDLDDDDEYRKRKHDDDSDDDSSVSDFDSSIDSDQLEEMQDLHEKIQEERIENRKLTAAVLKLSERGKRAAKKQKMFHDIMALSNGGGQQAQQGNGGTGGGEGDKSPVTRDEKPSC